MKGVKKAVWNMDEKIITVLFESKKISLEKTRELLAEAGHGTDGLCAHKKTLKSLPKCCKYTRDK